MTGGGGFLFSALFRREKQSWRFGLLLGHQIWAHEFSRAVRFHRGTLRCGRNGIRTHRRCQSWDSGFRTDGDSSVSLPFKRERWRGFRVTQLNWAWAEKPFQMQPAKKKQTCHLSPTWERQDGPVIYVNRPVNVWPPLRSVSVFFFTF